MKVSPAAEEVGSASTGVGGSVEATPISIDGDRPVQLSVGPPKEASAYESDKAPEVSLPGKSHKLERQGSRKNAALPRMLKVSSSGQMSISSRSVTTKTCTLGFS